MYGVYSCIKCLLLIAVAVDGFRVRSSMTRLGEQRMVSVEHFQSVLLAAGENVVKSCPAFGQPGWAPFCFLNGNPVFATFDRFQAFVQNSVVSLHDLLAVSIAVCITFL